MEKPSAMLVDLTIIVDTIPRAIPQNITPPKPSPTPTSIKPLV
jgi:hypothetical protein